MMSDDKETPAASETPSAPDPSGLCISQSFLPCLEQPLRLTLHCNGYYLWGLKKGRVVARKNRNVKDEFRLIKKEEGLVKIQSHKFGSFLSVVPQEEADGSKTYQIKCVKDESEKETKEEAVQEETEGNSQAVTEAEDEEEDDNEEEEKKNAGMTEEDDQHWCFIKVANSNQVMLKSLKTGQNLGVENGYVVLVPTDATTDTASCSILWNVECVTGELCFLQNAKLNSRVRCDMAGLVTLSSNWKGWEVFRFMETGSHHYVKITSWMHPWLLCSDKHGKVNTCSLSASFMADKEDSKEKVGSSVDTKDLCSQWAIEKAPQGEGMIIRSKKFGRLLSVKDGVLRTFHEDDDKPGQLVEETKKDASTGKSWFNNSFNHLQKQISNASLQETTQKLNKSMKSSVRNLQKQLGNESQEEQLVLEKDTVVWQLEAAHLQKYYFCSVMEDEKNLVSIGPFPQVTPNLRKTDAFRLIRRRARDGANVTKIFNEEKKQYVGCSEDGTIAFNGNGDDESTEWIMEQPEGSKGSAFKSKLYNFYLSYKEIKNAEDNEEVAEKTNHEEVKAITIDRGSSAGDDKEPAQVEKSEESKGDTSEQDGSVDQGDAGTSDKESSPTKSSFSTQKMQEQFSSLLKRKEADKVEELIGSETLGSREIWRLDPSMPRAVSSDKIKTFALGTSIAVGTTIAMPFALAGMGAILGAVGAEVGLLANVVAVGLTGAEALASVGAIGATAYIVFRPEENSLTDDHQEANEEEELAWSKRPFSNWRNW